MSPAASIDLPPGLRFDPNDLPPGVCFDPDDNELIMLYLLPRVRGQPDPFPGLIVEDDSAANTHPWKLFTRHGLPMEAPAFFYVRTDDAAAAAAAKKKGARRPDRLCHGGGTWKSMKRERDDAGHELLVGGEKIKWSRHNLNLNMGEGSIGWVMHEYSITASPSHRICRISFTGHGKKRMREPDDFEDDDLALAIGGEPVPRRARVAAAAAADDPASASSGSGSGITTAAFVQDSFMPTDGQQSEEARTTMEPMLDQDAVPHMDAGSATPYGFDEPVPVRARVAAAADDSAAASSGSGSGITTAAFVQDSFMPFIEDPPLQFQFQQSEEARTMEPMLDQDPGYATPDGLDDDSLAVGSAMQRPCVASAGSGFLASSASWTATTSFDQGVGAAHASQDQEHFQHLSDDEAILEMVAEMTAEMNDTQAQPSMDPLLEEGPSLCYEPNPYVSDMSAGIQTQGVVTWEEPFMPTDGELPLQFQQQLNEVRTVEQMVNQNVVTHMDAGTGAQGTYTWEGYNFCFDF